MEEETITKAEGDSAVAATEAAVSADVAKAAEGHAEAKHGVETHKAETGKDAGHEPSVINVDGQMVMWLWVVFFILLAILYKFAFKPIIAALDAREESIRKSVDEAEETRRKLEEVESTRADIIAKADDEAKDIVARGRKAAEEAAKTVKSKANDEAKILIENAEREIEDAENVARAKLRQESADVAIQIATKIVGENLDDAKNRALVDKLINEM